MNKYTKFCIVLTVLLFFSRTALAASDLQQLQTKAKGGDAVAQFVLGNSYYTGNGVTQNYKKARELWARAAKQHHPDALCDLLKNMRKIKAFTGLHHALSDWPYRRQMHLWLSGSPVSTIREC